MFEKLKKLFNIAPEVIPEPVAPKAKKAPKQKELTPKEQANAIGEPYVNIISVELDPADINNGSFELDWNDKFLLNLIKSGYKKQEDDTDNMIVDRWFATVCRNIVLELYEQNQADPANRDLRPSNTRDLGDGRVEVS